RRSAVCHRADRAADAGCVPPSARPARSRGTVMMKRGSDILCVSSIDWDFIWQGHQEIMSTLAADGHRVLFIENTGVRPPSMRDLPRVRQRLVNWWRSRSEEHTSELQSPDHLVC